MPGEATARPETVRGGLYQLRTVFPLDVSEPVSHDELQAVVAGLAGLALSDGHAAGLSISGTASIQTDGTWREGFIVNPIRRAETKT